MCGIVGYFTSENDFDKIKFSKAANIIKHRGPDDFGFITLDNKYNVSKWHNENLEDYSGDNFIGGFGFRRLSIIDLSASGHQPMSDVTGDYWIIFNGEIYNYIELRGELEKKRYRFNSFTDTEVILNSYREWGYDCLKRFNGMWSFCILDLNKRKLFCARDRLGIKPFYYFCDGNRFAFSSEIKQLLELFPGRFNDLNRRLAFDFLALGSYGNETNETYFKDILKLSPGCYIELDLLNINKYLINEIKWWDLPSEQDFSAGNETEIYENIRNLFEDSIRLRLRSDVPVGTALSGGLDSSGIVSVLNSVLKGDKEKNKVFTISNKVENIDDTYYANIIIENMPVISYMREFEEHANLNDLETFIWHQEEPLQNTSIFGSWQLYKFIKEMGITVALDGQGADELMGGYNRFPFRRYLIDIYRIYGYKYCLKQAGIIANVYGIANRKMYYNILISYISHFIKKFPRYYYYRKITNIKKWLNKDFIFDGFINSHLLNRNFYSEELTFSSVLKADSYELTKHTNLPGILRQVDRNSMAFSVESRLPFLDYRLVEFLYSLPVNYMIRNGFTKYAYRMAMKDLIPEKVLWRKTKVGFKMPEYSILKNNKKFIMDAVCSIYASNFVNTEYLYKKLDDHLDDVSKYNNIIWRILCFSVWKNCFNLN